MKGIMKRTILVITLLLVNSQFASAQSVIDVLVLYTNQANSGDIVAHAEEAVASLNESFTNSGLQNTVRARLAGAKSINRSEVNTTISSNLTWLSSTNNTLIQNLRNDHYADIVILMVTQIEHTGSGTIVGKANSVSPPREDKAFAVVSKNYAFQEESYTFSHEIGHIAGFRHHDYQDYLYQNKGYITASCSQGPKQFLSIMASENSFSTNDPKIKINRWSDKHHQIEVYSQGNGGGNDDDDKCPNPKECNKATNFTQSNSSCTRNFGTSYNNSKQGWIDHAPIISSFKTFPPPTNLAVITNNFGSPILSWSFNPTSEFDGYRVYRKQIGTHNQNCSNGSLSNYCLISEINSNSFTDWNVTNSGNEAKTFYYVVTAINNGVESSFSNVVSHQGDFSNFKQATEKTNKPSKFSISQNYPNPFNPSTRFELAVPEKVLATLKVYNIAGKEVATLLEGEINPGVYDFNFDGSSLPSGVYIAKFEGIGNSTANYNYEIKMTLLK